MISFRFKLYFLSLVLFLCLLTACNSSHAEIEWPQVNEETKPWSRWWWMGSIVSEKDLTAEMEKYARAGLGGLEITPIYGVKGYEDEFIDYLTPKWMDMLVHTLKEADRLGMGIDMATGNGWPFGGQWVGAKDACKNIVYKTYEIEGGERLQEKIVYIQEPMVRAIGRRVNINELTEPISANEDLQGLALEQVRFEKPLPLQVLMAYSDEGLVLDLTGKVDADGNLIWTAPVGSWTLYAIFQGWHGKMVERAGPGGEGNVIDHFSDTALKNYLSKFDMAYSGYDVSLMRAYFNDSYEVDDASGESNWTPQIFDEFQKRRGYDLREHLPALFGEDSEDKNIRVLCDFRETISDLLLEEFTIAWRQWTESKGATTRNQAHGSPAGLLDLYAASGIPETEGSDILGFKLASSAAHVTGKPLTSSESATWLDEHFQATLGDVKTALDRFFLGGVNHICYHGTTFSPPDENWPGWMFYASVHFGPTNSFWNDFSALNEYVTRCQSFLQSGKPDNDVLVYFPIYDEWSQEGRSLLQHFRQSVQGKARDVGQTILDGGYTFDFVSDRQIENLSFSSNAIQTGGVSYKAIVIPECKYIPLDTIKKLLELATEGTVVIILNNLPSDVPGWGNLERRRNDFQRITNQINFNEINDGSGIQKSQVEKGMFLLGNDLLKLLSHSGIEREPIVDSGLRFIRRSDGQSKIYFIINTGDKAVDDWIPVKKVGQSAAVFNPMTGSMGIGAFQASQVNDKVYLQLTPGESCIIKTFKASITGRSYKYVKAKGQPEQINNTWTVSFIEGGPELPSETRTKELGSWTNYEGDTFKKFSGTAKYVISFEKPQVDADAWQLDLGKVCESANVTLNGNDLGKLICEPFQISISKDMLKDQNVLEIKVSNLMANRIADLDRQGVEWKKFYNTNFPARRRENRGPDGLFNASKWAPRDSGLIGPVTLTPMDFIDL